jgi:hypothetical protein
MYKSVLCKLPGARNVRSKSWSAARYLVEAREGDTGSVGSQGLRDQFEVTDAIKFCSWLPSRDTKFLAGILYAHLPPYPRTCMIS